MDRGGPCFDVKEEKLSSWGIWGLGSSGWLEFLVVDFPCSHVI